MYEWNEMFTFLYTLWSNRDFHFFLLASSLSPPFPSLLYVIRRKIGLYCILWVITFRKKTFGFFLLNKRFSLFFVNFHISCIRKSEWIMWGMEEENKRDTRKGNSHFFSSFFLLSSINVSFSPRFIASTMSFTDVEKEEKWIWRRNFLFLWRKKVKILLFRNFHWIFNRTSRSLWRKKSFE